MSDFFPAFERMIVNEGGYKLTNDPVDRGGMTYAGIARKSNPRWSGWLSIDAGDTPPATEVRAFYKLNYWDAVRGDDIAHQRTAQSIFDFGVNAGPKTAAKLAQIVVGVTPDGAIGEKSLQALNMADPDRFALAYTIAKIARYRDIVVKDRSQIKYLVGWINRALKEAT